MKMKVICETWDSFNESLSLVTGTVGIILRNERHKMLFSKIMRRFPTAKSMHDFLELNNLKTIQLQPDMDQADYIEWVKSNIVKEGKFFRIFAQILIFGGPGLIYNLIKYNKEKNRSAEDSVKAYIPPEEDY